MSQHIYDLAESKLTGEKPKKHKKEVHEIRTRKAKSGGYIHEHHHTRPEEHPIEEHTTPDQDAMAAHMIEHMGEPNPGEASGGDEASAAPAGGAAAMPMSAGAGQAA